MFVSSALLFGLSIAIPISLICALFLLAILGAVGYYSVLWVPAWMTGADVTFLSLIGMGFRQVNAQRIVTAKIMATQAGLNIDRNDGITTAHLEAHVLSGGDVMRVVRAIIAASRGGMDLNFDRAAAIDLAGRDILEAVQISISPRVIDCPAQHGASRSTLSGVAKDGVELRVHACVTVRTNLNQLIGGATEETIVARVGQGIVSSIGTAATYLDVMSVPERISKNVLHRGLDANSAFEILSIDVAQIEVGENVGARLQTDQAQADMRIAQAHAEVRRAGAIAAQQEMKAKIAASEAALELAMADIPAAVAQAFRAGHMYAEKRSKKRIVTPKATSLISVLSPN